MTAERSAGARVAVCQTGASRYPEAAPFSPGARYPEYPFPDPPGAEPNPVYEGVRQLFQLLELDRAHAGQPEWNPLGGLLEPGMTVVLKPNFVVSRQPPGKDLFAAVTHASVLRAVADYCWIALRGTGRIVIADAPQYDCDMAELRQALGLDRLLAFYEGRRGPAVELRDLRAYWSRWKHFPSLLEPLPGDPEGRLTVNLGPRSALYGKPHPDKLYGAVYHRWETIAHHTGERHEYEVARTVMNADAVFSIPKLKVHKKVGVTLNVKGLVGINTNKNYLVHYSVTPPSRGGDQYPDGLLRPHEELLIRLERWMYDHLLAPRRRGREHLHRSLYWLHNHSTKRLGWKVDPRKRMLDAGNWYGNDSAWRMAVDLLRIFLFADRQGVLQPRVQRRVFSVVDGIIGGDNNGPLAPDPHPAGVLLGGDNLLATDLVGARLMGFDPLKMRAFTHLLQDPHFEYGVRSLDDIRVVSNYTPWQGILADREDRGLQFKPHPGWVGHLEMGPAAAPGANGNEGR